MKYLTLTTCAITLLLLACNNEKKTDETKTDKDTTKTATTEIKTGEMTPMPDSATMMKNMEAYGTPGEQQKMLAKSNGTWTTEVTGWEAPGATPFTSKGVAVNKMIMGGRYQESTNNGDMMGMSFEGRGVTGYDNAKKIFVASWIDNMGTGIMNMEGPWDEATHSITLKGKAVNAATLKEADYREVFKIIDDNNQLMEMYGPGPDGKEYKMMEIKYKRKK